jgi:hypothetical protein
LLAVPRMTSMGYSSRLCAIVFALGACMTEDAIEDLGSLGDGKGDTVLPRTVDLELAPGTSRRFRITTAAFVASVTQADDVDVQLTAKHFEHEFESDVSRAPLLDVAADGTVRNWTLVVHNRGDALVEGRLVIDLPRDASELGIVSDIDKTVMPPESPTGLVPPYPGIATMLHILEGAKPGDLHYVTARTPDGVAEVPAWMELHGVPPGSIDTGISGVPQVAQAEKVRDITRLFEANLQQTFVLFGDTSHRDPEVYKEILAKFPDRVAAVFINKVNVTVNPTRVVGMHLVENYAQAAAHAFGRRLITEAQAREVMAAARTEGLELTDAEIDALIDAAR